ncbi:FAD-binding oxidoreductase [Demequina litorisediminis]|uniref:FAD-binding oxidoreductase n=1 Tax=Demequina litorisediminis TaxID=1849022 RepID=UPI0032AEAA73
MSLQKAAAPHGLRFGPDPSTTNRATLGGLIGNNACGPHAVAHGKTSDNVIGLDVVTGDGRRVLAGRKGVAAIDGLDALVRANLALIRTEFGRFERQVSGYSLQHLLPEARRRSRQVPRRHRGHAGDHARGDRAAGAHRARATHGGVWLRGHAGGGRCRGAHHGPQAPRGRGSRCPSHRPDQGREG